LLNDDNEGCPFVLPFVLPFEGFSFKSVKSVKISFQNCDNLKVHIDKHFSDCFEHVFGSIGPTGAEIWPFKVFSTEKFMPLVLPFVQPFVLPLHETYKGDDCSLFVQPFDNDVIHNNNYQGHKGYKN
jgi:hypothetical protein